MFEKYLPGKRTTGFNQEQEIGNMPLETCETINSALDFNAGDKRFKSTRDLIHYLLKAAGYNANFLLNERPIPSASQNSSSAGRPWGITTLEGAGFFCMSWTGRIPCWSFRSWSETQNPPRL
jgi:hypothetical protein